MTSTRRSLELLDELEQLGFDDAAFGLLHHFRATRDHMDTMARHRQYCREHESFRAGDTNEKVQKRLELVVNAYRAGPFNRGGPVFALLAEAAVCEVPFE
jgi:methylglyoxal synthase